MKKKIKDVTFGDIVKECAKYKQCIDCPLYIYDRCINTYLHRRIPQGTEDEFGVLEKEVEIG